jgi:hypothetical protein
MEGEQVVSPRLEELATNLNVEIEELEPIIAPGNTWSV